MKKYFKYIGAIALVAMAAMSLSSCSEKGFDETIFPDVTDELDPSSYTYKFDKWLKENYLDVYNLEFQYRLKDTETDMYYNLEPATLANSIDLAVLAKYMWFDVYEEVSGSKEFVKMYGPRILMLVGSPAINPQSGTTVVGLAEGGIKVTLLNVNAMNVNNIYALNGDYFHTMHHEFSHILHQTKSIPREIQLLSLGHYDASNWQDRDPRVVNSLGFVTPYGSSEIREDFAETIANYITKTDAEWELIWRNASRGFWTEGDETSQDMSTLTYYTYFYYENNEVNEEKRKGTIFENIEFKDDGTMTLRGQSQRGKGTPTKQDDGTYLDEDGKLVDRQGFLLDSEGHRIPIYVYDVEDRDGVDGVALLTQKINIARNWFKEQWNIDLDELRNAVQTRVSNYTPEVLESLRQQVNNMQ